MILKNLIGTAVIVALMFIVSAFAYNSKNEETHKNLPSENKGFAVLELFTSEGCSSCPPADQLLGEIEKQYKNQHLYILSYHVDYWNNLGWKDKFSSAENSKRQLHYSQTLQTQIYTPQLVINGKKEFVGSDRYAVEKAIQKALLTSSNSKIDLSANISQKNITVKYKTAQNTSQYKILITLIKKKASNAIQRGENEGRHLVHWQIVHQQNQISLEKTSEGTTDFKLPENFDATNWEIIGMIQNVKSGEILGSEKVSF
ncbi:DUF1223 domain-containing protein [Chryseobacterium sp. JAH]|uniref:DUF1223 domain-containing protein n=1 Tax=Chryseobacterium sp. JAH TaxID=1742858 RepID=UPI0007410427|nr:DUF1223 domain-containing protein [Chryseobacterium sp. JAH]KUJ53394.1 hypothetical protein AR685_03125 [Chryseobacterium sp. JAH]